MSSKSQTTNKNSKTSTKVTSQKAGASNASTTEEVAVVVAPVAVAPVAVAPVVVAPVAVEPVTAAPATQTGGAKSKKSKAAKVAVPEVVTEATPVAVSAAPAVEDVAQVGGAKAKKPRAPKQSAKNTKATTEVKTKSAKAPKTPKTPKAPKAQKGVATEDEPEAVTNSDGKVVRSFKVMLPGVETYEGRFTGLTPYQAANKALSKYYRETEQPKKEIVFTIRESTRGSKRSTYTYNGKREKLKVPVEYSIKDGRTIVKNFKNRLVKVKKNEETTVTA
jgi:hypothetical protein